MRDRSNQLSIEFVQAFNLIQIEFADSKEVVSAWKSLTESRNAAGPAKDDAEGWNRKTAEWNNKTDKLLFEITKVLKIEVNPLDIQGSYFPVGWNNELKKIYELRIC